MITNIVYNEDCLMGLPKIPSKSIDLIVIDPPYNIKKDSWDNIKNYDEWLKKVILELQRVLKDNGSFYMFHSEMEVIADIMNFMRNETDFVFKQFIVWNKRFEGARNKGFLDGFVVPEGLRNYQQMAEYCLFYTFQDETGLTTIFKEHDCFSEMREYSQRLREYIEYSRQKMVDMLGNGRSQHYLEPYGPQWQLCTAETYKDLIDKFKINKMDGFREYEDLRREYEDLRYTFNNQKTHHSVWNYEIAERNGHMTPKPLELIKNIIRHSSNEGQIVLDCFMGYGTTAEACKELNRQYIGFEISTEYCKIIEQRLSQETLRGFFDTMDNRRLSGSDDKSSSTQTPDWASDTRTDVIHNPGSPSESSHE